MSQQRGWGRDRMVRRVIGACFLVMLVIAAVSGARDALSLRRHMLNGASHLQAAQARLSAATANGQSFGISTGDLDRADGDLASAQVEFAAAHAELDALGTGVALARHLPIVGNTVAAAPNLVGFALAATRGSRELVAALRPLAQERDIPSKQSPAAVRFSTALSAGSVDFQAAQQDLQRAQAYRGAVREGTILPVFRGALRPLATWDRQWPAVQSDLDLLVRLPPVVQSVLGFDGPRTYAILGQNSAELRPTGGFLGTMGLVTFEKGAMTREDYRTTYSYDPDNAGRTRPLPPAPEPLVAHLGIAGWHIQDANWSPDFPTSAQAFRAFLDYDSGIKVDGVIAFDSYAVQEILRALGPIDVEIDGTTQQFTADNWLPLTTRLIFLDPEHPDEFAGKERVFSPLLQAVIARVNGVSGSQLTSLTQALRTAIVERHILFQFDETAAQKLAYDYGADGSLQLKPGETTVYPVEANLSYTKIGPFIQQHAAYEIWCNEAGVCDRLHLALSWTNSITAQQIADPINRIVGDEWDAATGQLMHEPGVYGIYERVYSPEGTALLDASGTQEAVGQTSDGNFAVFGTYLSIQPGQTRAIDLSFTLRDRESRPGRFELDIPKQPGTQDRSVEIIVHTAAGKAPTANLALTADGPQTYRYQGALNRSLQFRLRLAQ